MKKSLILLCLISSVAHAGTISSFFNNIITTQDINIIPKVTKKPETFFNQSVQELNNTIGQFGDKKTKVSYLKFVIENYSVDYPKKENSSISVFGKENTIYYIVNLSDSLVSSANASEKIDFGFKRAVCESSMNSLLLDNGVKFEAKFISNGNFLYKVSLSENCLNDLIVESPEEKHKSAIEKTKEDKIMVNPQPVEAEKSKENVIYIPQEFIHADTGRKPTAETSEDFVVIKAIEEPNVTKQEIAKIIKLSEAEKEKLNTGLIKKDNNLKEIIARINELYDGANNDYEKRLFREHIAELTKEFYNKLLSAKKKDNTKKLKNNIVVDKEFDVVSISVYFTPQSSAELKKNKLKWKKNNEAKSFVCEDMFLSKMLDIGIKYKVLYYDSKNELVYSEDVIGNNKICKLK